MSKIITLFLILSCLPLTAATTADLYNQQGYAQYQKKQYKEALELFRKGIKADANHLYANYNLACTLAILLEQQYCSYLDNVGEMFTSLERSFRIKPAQRQHAAVDPDLKHCRKYLRYYKIMNYSWNKSDHLRTILTRVVWAVPGPGAINPIAEIRFLANGTFTAGEGWEKQKNGEYDKNTFQGRYQITIENRKVYLLFQSNSRPWHKVHWKPWGGFRVVPNGYKYINYLGDCSA